MRIVFYLSCCGLGILDVSCQSPSNAWAGYAHDAQHDGVSTATVSQSLNAVHWSTQVDLNSGESPIHYGSPMVTPANTVLVPVRNGDDTFRVSAFNGNTGVLMYTLSTDYILPPHKWTPSYGPILTMMHGLGRIIAERFGGPPFHPVPRVRSRIYYPGVGGTVYYRDDVDFGASGATGQIAFYGNDVYSGSRGLFDGVVMISTPLTADEQGNIYFGFEVTGANPANLTSGIARISSSGDGTWIGASAASGGDGSITQVALNCAPALSIDNGVLYFVGVTRLDQPASGYLTSVDSTTLKPLSRIMLMDPRGSSATISPDSSASPTIGQDGDVYFGVLENPCCRSHNNRGWMLHFDAGLTMSKTPGSFGWDATASVVPASLVPSYVGSSKYLILTKYNNYAGIGTGDGVNRMAVLDPNESQPDLYSSAGVQVMREVLTIVGLTRERLRGFPDAVFEWCVNSAVIDPVTKSAVVNSEDGVTYRWSFPTNTFSESVRLTDGASEAYTPTLLGSDGTVYAISNGMLFAVGN